MKSPLMSLRKPTALLALAAFVLSTSAALAATPLNLLQAPPTSNFKSIAPNITFLLDDSGSMQFEFLGTSGTVDNYYGYPPGKTQVYGGNNYGDNFPPFSASSTNAAQYRSSYVNPNYYNPTVTYTPFACTGPYQQAPTDNPSSYAATQYAGSTDVNGQYCHWDANAKLWVMPDAKPGKTMLNPGLADSWRSLNVWNDSTNSNNNDKDNGYIADAKTKFVNGGKEKKKTGFWPATYFNYFGPKPGENSDYSNINNYQYVQICPPNATYTTNSSGVKSSDTITVNGVEMPICSAPPSLPTSPLPNHAYLDTAGNYVYVKSDGTQVVRSYAQEMQNFANWYQYYRSHILMARAGVGQAFMKLQPNFRVNFALLNAAASDSSQPVQYSTAHSFDLAQSRTDFMERLYQTPIPAQGTPSRMAVYNIGQWLSQTPSQSAPWGARDAERQALNQLGVTDDTAILNSLSCRQNYLVFATDGDWNGDSGLVDSNQDGTDGSPITGPGGQSYTYTKASPYKDSYFSTLADNAMYYWKRDIQPDLPNDVPTNSQDPAFWQHMVMFGVGLGVNGTSDLPQMLAGTKAWPNPNDGALERIDDLAHAGLDTRGGYLSAADPSAFANALTTTLADIVSRVSSSTSAAVSAQPAGEYKTTTQAFAASYHPNGWWGELMAYPIVRTSNGGLAQGQYANWNASCVLTGGTCPSMQNDPSISAQSSRVLLTWSNNTGAAFNASNTGLNSNLADYLSGSRTQEQPSGAFRKRTGVLGDIVDSSPLWVGPPSYSYGTSIKDLLTGTTGSETSYPSFQSSQAQREQIIYAGANDGFVHGFRAGSNDANGDFNTATNDGQEVLAYFPSVLASSIGDYASPNYAHRYYVDATPGTGDLYYSGAWHTWLVGGLGAGGRGFYALDVTDPSKFSTSNAANIVKAEVNASNIDALCGVSDGSCSNDLGDTFGTPIIRRMHDGKWAVIAGNGYNSPSGNASIFIALIDPSTGQWSIKDIPVAGPVNGHANGIAYVTAADLDGDKIADYLYAADLYGQVWRIDVTSPSSANWVTPNLVYSAADSSNNPQPITTQVVVSSVPQSSGDSKIIVMFGTGSSLTQAGLGSTQTQTVYGIWDGDMAAWNGKSSVKYAAWTTAPTAAGRSSLQQQTVINLGTQGGLSYRSLTNNPVCWAGASSLTGCSQYNKYGWYVDLPASGERVAYNPVLINGALQLNTAIPSAGVGLTCNVTPASGFSMAFNPATGGVFDENNQQLPFFADQNNNLTLINNYPIMGIGFGATGSIGIIRDNGKAFAVINKQSGGVQFNQQRSLGGNGPGGRVTWIQLR